MSYPAEVHSRAWKLQYDAVQERMAYGPSEEEALWIHIAELQIKVERLIALSVADKSEGGPDA